MKFLRIYYTPKRAFKGEDMGALSAKAKYTLQRSEERARARGDMYIAAPSLLQGEIGRIDGFRFYPADGG